MGTSISVLRDSRISAIKPFIKEKGSERSEYEKAHPKSSVQILFLIHVALENIVTSYLK